MGKNVRKGHGYYEENKEAIMADLLSTGRAATRKKWGIPSGGTLPQLEQRWLTQEQRDALGHLGQAVASPPPIVVQRAQDNSWLPPLPEFSNSWEPEVQIMWLEVYERVATSWYRHDEMVELVKNI